MIATAFVSMWISNSATAMMMLPIGLAVVRHITEQQGAEALGAMTDQLKLRFAVCMMLGIAYAASIGGVGTLIGTPPNAIAFGSGLVTIPQMAKAGLVLNFIGVVIVTALTYFLVIPLLGIMVK